MSTAKNSPIQVVMPYYSLARIAKIPMSNYDMFYPAKI